MIWLAMVFIIVGASLQTSAHNLAHLIVGRVITGLGTGIDSSTVRPQSCPRAEKLRRQLTGNRFYRSRCTRAS